eukprot:TRINITY_DN9910_c0_g1_i1.p1 TRINITY_DN9910_c0_g1~~TRINITY_DN9910_c0_g1_i1.p1  ORF type:complete len:919 (-),score=142.57 TRINITY_DN9910_c0_g1_i1:87-2843(-)
MDEERKPLIARSANSIDSNPPKLESFQYRALLRRHATLQQRQKLTTICQALVPLMLLLLGGVFQLIVNALIPSGLSVQIIPPRIPLQLPPFGIQYFSFAYVVPPAPGQGEIGFLYKNGSHHGFLGKVQQLPYFPPNQSMIGVPFFENQASDAAGQAQILSILRGFSNIPLYLVHNYHYDAYYELPTGLLVFSSVNGSQLQLSYTARVNDDPDYIRMPRIPTSEYLNSAAASDAFHVNSAAASDAFYMKSEVIKEGVGSVVGADPFAFLHSGVNVTLPRAILMSSLHNALTTLWKGVNIEAYLSGFPFTLQPPALVVLDLLGFALYPYALSFLLPVLLYSLVLERENKILGLMNAVGLKMSAYWISHFIFCFFLYALVAAVFMIFGFAFQVRFFTQSSIILLLMLLVLWGFAIISLAMMISNVFSRTRTATIVSYLIVIFSVNFALYFNFQVFKEVQPSFGYMMFAPFAFYRGLYLMSNACMLYECLQMKDFVSSQMASVFGYLVLEIPLMLLVNYWAYRARKDGLLWCFASCINWCRNGCCCCRRSSSRKQHAVLPININDSDDDVALASALASNEQSEDEDVTQERKRVLSDNYPDDCPVVAKLVKKTYDGKPEPALRGVTMSINAGECFGLLGPNGAGKTTFLSILTGLIPLSSGSVNIAGYSVEKDISTVRRLIGICPQHDVLWDDLTCTEHLLFYCRLKGVPADREQAEVRTLLECVGLEHVPSRRAGALSGGMKRRLSVAISLAGDPKIVFMDEPTTGTDPHTRRQLWKVIGNVSRGRCVLLTTHRMDEADVLCSRIAILAEGSLRCIGEQQRLKTKYGGGYVLRANFLPRDQSRVLDFVSSLLPGVPGHLEAQGTSTHAVPRDISIAPLFAAMEARSQSAGITAWSITQTSLEDVFLSIVQGADRTPKNRPE